MYSAIHQKLLDQASEVDTATATPRAFKGCGVVETSHYINWNDGTTTGEVTIETADDPDYAGAWVAVTTVTFDGAAVAAPKVEYVRVQGAYPALRHRVSQPVNDGGSVTTRISGSV